MTLTHLRHAGLDPASTFLFSAAAQEDGPRIKSGVTKRCDCDRA